MTLSYLITGMPFKPLGYLVPNLSHQINSHFFLILVLSIVSGFLSIALASKSLNDEWPGSLKWIAMGICFLAKVQDLWSVNLSDKHLPVSPTYCLLHFIQVIKYIG